MESDPFPFPSTPASSNDDSIDVEQPMNASMISSTKRRRQRHRSHEACRNDATVIVPESTDKNVATKNRPESTSRNSEIHANRTNMAIVHFLMTSPKWSIGLFLFLAGHTSPIKSPSNTIHESISRLRALVQMESQSYQTCIDHSWERKQRQLSDVATYERSKILEMHKMNQHTVLQAQDDVTMCLEKTTKARDMLVQWRNDGGIVPWTAAATNETMDPATMPSCSADDQKRVVTLLGQDFQLVEDQVTQVMENYVKDSERSLKLVHLYALTRFQYDYDYFVGLKLQPALDYLSSLDVNLQSVQIDLEVNWIGLRSQIEKSLAKLNLTLIRAKQVIDILNNKLEEFVDVIDGLYFNYADAYDRLRRVVTFINDAVPDIIELPSFLNVDTLPIPDSLLPASFFWPRPALDFDDIRDSIATAADEYLLIVQNLLRDLRTMASVQLQGQMKDVLENLLHILELKDYNPPQFRGSINGISSMAQELDFQGFRGQQTLNRTAEVMSNIRDRTSDLSINSDGVEGPNITSFDYSYVDDSTEFSYLGILLPDISFPEFIARMTSWIANNTWILEIAIQAYRLFKLEAMYIRGAIPHLPEIDYCDNDDHDDEDSNIKTKYMILMFVIKSFATPRMICFMIFLPVAVVSIAFWFPHVHKSCVQSNDGTFIANNFLTPLMINEANLRGNVRFLHTEFQCQQAQRQFCTNVATEAESQYQADLTAMHALQLQNNKSIDILDLMGSCIDAQQMTHSLQAACCGLKGYTKVSSSGNTTCLSPMNEGNMHISGRRSDFICPIDKAADPPSAFLPLATYLKEPSCRQHIPDPILSMEHGHDWTLIDTRYNCSDLVDVCYHIPCAGADEDLIGRQVIATDCEVEMYAIDVCYFLLALFVHAITINIVLTLIFNGIRQIRWRTLSPDGIHLRTNLRENGQLAKGDDMNDRSDRIAKAVRRFELIGKLHIGLGSIILLVYVIGTLVFTL